MKCVKKHRERERLVLIPYYHRKRYLPIEERKQIPYHDTLSTGTDEPKR